MCGLEEHHICTSRYLESSSHHPICDIIIISCHYLQVVNVPSDVAEGDDAVNAFIVEARSRFNVNFERIQALDDVHQVQLLRLNQ